MAKNLLCTNEELFYEQLIMNDLFYKKISSIKYKKSLFSV